MDKIKDLRMVSLISSFAAHSLLEATISNSPVKAAAFFTLFHLKLRLCFEEWVQSTNAQVTKNILMFHKQTLVGGK